MPCATTYLRRFDLSMPSSSASFLECDMFHLLSPYLRISLSLYHGQPYCKCNDTLHLGLSLPVPSIQRRTRPQLPSCRPRPLTGRPWPDRSGLRPVALAMTRRLHRPTWSSTRFRPCLPIGGTMPTGRPRDYWANLASRPLCGS